MGQKITDAPENKNDDTRIKQLSGSRPYKGRWAIGATPLWELTGRFMYLISTDIAMGSAIWGDLYKLQTLKINRKYRTHKTTE